MMNFSLTQDQQDLAAAAQQFLREQCPPEKLRHCVDENLADTQLWPEITAMGLTAILIPEDRGGLGLSAVEFALVAQEIGYTALPEPLSEVAGVAAPALAAMNNAACDDLLSQIAEGEARALVMHPLNPFINQLREQDFLLYCQPEQASIHLLEARQFNCQPRQSIDPLRRLCQLNQDQLKDALASAPLVSGLEAQQIADDCRWRGALFNAAELLGLATAMLDMATEYVQQRQQFGVAIGSFQAVKHHLANAFVAIEFARPCLYRAASTLDAMHVSHAKVATITAAINTAEAAIQVHGGMGYTFEVNLHLWMKRVWSLAGLWGDKSFHLRQLEQRVFADGNTHGNTDGPTDNRGWAAGPGNTFN